MKKLYEFISIVLSAVGLASLLVYVCIFFSVLKEGNGVNHDGVMDIGVVTMTIFLGTIAFSLLARNEKE